MAKKTSEDWIWGPGRPNPGPAYLGENNLARDKYKRPEKLLEKPDAIVIGSGIGGLGTASMLAQKKGMKVLVLEANSVPGGCMHNHELDGYEWNTGIDSIGDMDPTKGRGLYRPTIDYLTGGGLEWAKMPDLHERCCFGDEVYDWYSSVEQNVAWVKEKFPGEGDVDGYYRLEESIEAAGWAFALTLLLPKWIPESLRAFFYKVFGGSWRRYMLKSSRSVFEGSLGFSKKLAAVFSYMYGNHGRTPEEAPFAFHAVNLFHYRDGSFYPVGGPGQITECIVPIIEKAGGQVATSCPVAEILVEGNTAVGVRLESGETIRAPLIVSDTGAYTTFMELLPRELSERHGYAQRFDDVEPSPAHVFLFLGYDEAIDLPPQVIWHMPEYEEVDAYDLSAADRHYKANEVWEGMGGYLLSPSARDPIYQQRYPNKATVEILAEAPHDWCTRFATDPEWRDQTREALIKNLTRIAHRHMPELKDKTPSFTLAGAPMGCNPRAWKGCSYGLAPNGDRFTKHATWLRPRTELNNLYMTGQDAFTMGFCGSMLSARMTYSAITGNWFHMLMKNP